MYFVWAFEAETGISAHTLKWRWWWFEILTAASTKFRVFWDILLPEDSELDNDYVFI